MARPCTRGLPFRGWPGADARLWHDLTRCGDPLDSHGALSHLRRASLETHRFGYGFFLGHLKAIGQDLEAEVPCSRVKEATLRSWLASLEDLSPRTKAGYFASLRAVMTAAYPERDWTLLRRVTARLHAAARRAEPARRKVEIPLSQDLLALGHKMMAAASSAYTPRLRAEGFRDGLMILVLASHPLRLSNFAGLELGGSFKRDGEGFRFHLSEAETKTHRPITISLSPELVSNMQVYLDDVRPSFPGGGTQFRGRLWLRHTYGPWDAKAIGRHISRLTGNGLGYRVSPHRFRDAAATTLAITDGADPNIIRPLLTHATSVTAERHYIQARQIEAGRLLLLAQSQLSRRG